MDAFVDGGLRPASRLSDAVDRAGRGHVHISPLLPKRGLLPARVQREDTIATDYLDVRINEPIPDEEFRPEVGPDVRTAEPEPLAEGYTRRFLKVDDGTGGRMSVRWGMTGPKGTNSSGLN